MHQKRKKTREIKYISISRKTMEITYSKYKNFVKLIHFISQDFQNRVEKKNCEPTTRFFVFKTYHNSISLL